MQYSIASEIFGLPWHISVQGLQQYMPVVRGMLNGAMIVEETEPKENIPFAISANTLAPVSGYYADDQEDDDNEDDEATYEKVVHVLPLRGVLMKNDMMCGPRGARTMGQRLVNADKDKSVIGHVIIIEGPGGAAHAVPELTDAIKECTKPIVVWVDGLMCSAHMYVGAFAAERIASRATDMVGCIGTMLVYEGRTAKSEENELNIRQVTIYADDAFEKNEEYEQAINEFNFKPAKERLLNPHNEQFVNDLKAQLPGVEDKHLHGRTFQAGEVIGSLIDRIGSFDDAVNRVIELANYTPKENPTSSLGGQTENNQSKIQSSMKFPKIQSALAQDSLEFEADGRRTFTEDEMTALETAIGDPGSEELEHQLELENSARLAAEASLQTAQEATTAAEQTIAERDQTIATLQGEVATLKAGPAEHAAIAATEQDVEGAVKPGPVSSKHEDLGSQLEAVSQEYLGKPLK
jgi:ClpP class serine protease